MYNQVTHRHSLLLPKAHVRRARCSYNTQSNGINHPRAWARCPRAKVGIQYEQQDKEEWIIQTSWFTYMRLSWQDITNAPWLQLPHNSLQVQSKPKFQMECSFISLQGAQQAKEALCFTGEEQSIKVLPLSVFWTSAHLQKPATPTAYPTSSIRAPANYTQLVVPFLGLTERGKWLGSRVPVQPSL